MVQMVWTADTELLPFWALGLLTFNIFSPTQEIYSLVSTYTWVCSSAYYVVAHSASNPLAWVEVSSYPELQKTHNKTRTHTPKPYDTIDDTLPGNEQNENITKKKHKSVSYQIQKLQRTAPSTRNQLITTPSKI